ncbi:DUF4382 domain-containing protein [Ferrimonas sediminicola]|uniref:DUF4382 domain-containing protein n=1 Tax=Ferrimonas sediminicola TaxID=2569538 RepID=A0A4U1BME7_9GAMM|nr:DUF4382 domain-containing protein [Ferrimonas sediminicola]TKB51298.1 DUF4382 domain-containing protein [Ferrimonas sediminicola]
MIKPLSVLSLALLVAGCGGGSSSSPQTGQFGLAVSDAPVEQADEVVLFFNEVVLVPEDGGEPVTIDLSEDGPDSVDLLQYTGSDSATLVNGQVLPVGDYTMCLYALDGDGSEQLSYVNTQDQGVVPLKVNSKGSCQGVQGNTDQAGRIFFNRPFTINTGINNFVAEFNLRQGLVDPQGQEGMYIKPTAVQLVNLAGAGNIAGVLAEQQREACEADMASLLEVSEFSHVAYLYAGERDRSTMGDLVGEAGYPAESPLVAPVATADISLDEASGEYRYEFGFIGEGNYSIGYSCVANFDLPESHETEEQDFTFYQHYTPVQVQPGQTTTQNLDPIL